MISAEVYPSKYNSLVSLLDMLKDYANVYYRIGQSFSNLKHFQHTGVGSALGYEAEVKMKRFLVQINSEVQDISLHHTKQRLNRLISKVNPQISFNELKEDLRVLQETLEDELSENYFLHLPLYKANKYQQKNLFGKEVTDAFPSAKFDIREAGTAFACGLYTACVFHLTSATEYFLRAVARDRKIVLPKKSTLDRATWEAVLRELDKELINIANWPNAKGEVKTQAQEFYGAAIAEIRAIKDTWRNPVSHSKGNYVEIDALQVMAHVERLGQTLATRISESTRTPRVWTKAQLLVS